MKLDDLLNEFGNHPEQNNKISGWSQSTSFSGQARAIFQTIIRPVVSETIDSFNKAGCPCINKQSLHPVVGGCKEENLFFSVEIGGETMQLNFFTDYLTERFRVEAFFSNAHQRNIDYSIWEISQENVEHIVAEYTKEFLRLLPRQEASSVEPVIPQEFSADKHDLMHSPSKTTSAGGTFATACFSNVKMLQDDAKQPCFFVQ